MTRRNAMRAHPSGSVFYMPLLNIIANNYTLAVKATLYGRYPIMEYVVNWYGVNVPYYHFEVNMAQIRREINAGRGYINASRQEHYLHEIAPLGVLPVNMYGPANDLLNLMVGSCFLREEGISSIKKIHMFTLNITF